MDILSGTHISLYTFYALISFLPFVMNTIFVYIYFDIFHSLLLLFFDLTHVWRHMLEVDFGWLVVMQRATNDRIIIYTHLYFWFLVGRVL